MIKSMNSAGSNQSLQEVKLRVPYVKPKLTAFGTLASHVRGSGSQASEGNGKKTAGM